MSAGNIWAPLSSKSTSLEGGWSGGGAPGEQLLRGLREVTVERSVRIVVESRESLL